MCFRQFVIYISLLLFFSACRNNDRDTYRAVDDVQSNDYSSRFIIEQFEGYSKLTVKNPWQGAKNRNYIYYIGKDKSLIPTDVPETNIIISPVKSIVCTSTTHISMIDTLGGIEQISAVSGSSYVYNRKIRERIYDEKVFDIGYENGYNTELIYSIDPDVVLVYGVGSESVPVFSRLISMGIPVLYIADYLEQHPLARAEWIKVYGELLGKRELAENIFRAVRDEYITVVETIENNRREPAKVMLGLPFKDSWFVSPGNSYIARLIEDAGGQYLWSDKNSDTSIPMSLEAVCRKALEADIWLNTGTATSLEDIRSVDNRLAELPLISEGLVYNNNKRINSHGGNDYWESGALNPHIILKDMASIINPGLFPKHELFYYKRLKTLTDTLK
ncbi:MAG: ABC transporter substrate-binding protein [Bacteroidales bacterium]|nr:ABC transporter substrate-binding protein [Bacteroidales bacterium]